MKSIIMDDFLEVFNTTNITLQSGSLRMLVSFLIGALVGIEREIQNQPAGLRTHILISIGSTLAMLVSIYIPQTFTLFQNGDPSRIAAQVVSGIGFLGAGAILKFGVNVKGLTTAASIWAMAVLGLAVGAGMFVLSAVGVGIVLFALIIVDIFEKRLFKERITRKIDLVIKKSNSDIQELKSLLLQHNIKVISTGFERNVNEITNRITFKVNMVQGENEQSLIDIFEGYPGFVSISMELME